MTSDDQYTRSDPTRQFRTDDFPAGPIEHPGLTRDLITQPDHGEESYRGSGRLLGKRAVITGGDSGIGRAVAIAFAREGADVLISYLPQEQEDADETARWIRDAGRAAVTVPGDIREERTCVE